MAHALQFGGLVFEADATLQVQRVIQRILLESAQARPVVQALVEG
jgi:hypothetical protein